MPRKAVPPQGFNVDAGISKELEYLRAQLAAVEKLIRALEGYREFYPQLVVRKDETA